MNAPEKPMRSEPVMPRPAAMARATASSTPRQAGPRSSLSCSPMGVGVTCRLVRSNSFAPTRRSRRAMVWLTLLCETPTRSAVRPKCSSSARVRKISISWRSMNDSPAPLGRA